VLGCLPNLVGGVGLALREHQEADHQRYEGEGAADEEGGPEPLEERVVGRVHQLVTLADLGG
jgi:hypothetical protein